MHKKRSEEEVGRLFRSLGFFVRKGRDRGYPSCPSCHRAIIICPFCHSSTLMPKSEEIADFVISRNYFDLEAKEATDGGNRFPFSDISETQRKVLGVSKEGWLFLLIGPGRAPNGRQAFLIPWPQWREKEVELLENNVKSLVFQQTQKSRVPSARDVFPDYELQWSKGEWEIPVTHPYWRIQEENYGRV